MINFIKTATILVCAAFGVFAFTVQPQLNVKAESPAAFSANVENSSDSARAVYLRNCARCHGADGKSQTDLGITQDAPDLTKDKASMARIVQVITKGAGGMPAFGKKLTKAQINTLAGYVRSL